MSYLLEKAKEKVKKLETELDELQYLMSSDVENNIVCELPKLKETIKKVEFLTDKLNNAKQKLAKLEKLDAEGLDKVAADMKIILKHTTAVEDKYNCRSVKFMFSTVEFLDNHISKSLAEKLRNYIITKIHAPVCSIVGNSKPELEPMPVEYEYHLITDDLRETRQRELAELKKYRDLWVDYAYAKPSTKWERFKGKFKTLKSA